MFKKLIICTAILWSTAADAQNVIRAKGGDIQIDARTSVVVVLDRSTIRLPKADENRPPIHVGVLGSKGIGSRIIAGSGETIQGRASLGLDAEDVSVLLFPVNGLGYVQ